MDDKDRSSMGAEKSPSPSLTAFSGLAAGRRGLAILAGAAERLSAAAAGTARAVRGLSGVQGRLVEAVKNKDAAEALAMLRAGGDPHRGGRPGDPSPFELAAVRGVEDVLRAMLEHGVDPNNGSLKAPPERPVLVKVCQEALFGGAVEEIVEILLEGGADPNLGDPRSGYTSLQLAAGSDDGALAVALAGRLLAAGADPNARDKEGRTALIVAASSSNEGALRVLLAAGARTEDADDRGMTAVMAACRGRPSRPGHRSDAEDGCVELLAERGADLSKVDKERRSALDYAKMNGRDALARRLNEMMLSRLERSELHAQAAHPASLRPKAMRV